jgi:hypothetical protein
LKIPKEKLEVLQKVVSSSQTTDDIKKMMIKKSAEVSPCCVCGGLPSLEVRYPVPDGGATRIERYCESCIQKVYEREQVL